MTINYTLLILLNIIVIFNYLYAIGQNFERQNVASTHRLLAHRHKRYIILDRSKPNKQYQNCTSIGGRPGHCKFTAYCQLGNQTEIKKLLDHLCIIEEQGIGVCCPDDVGTFDPTGSNIIYGLPSTGDADVLNQMDENADIFKTPANHGCGVPTNINQEENGRIDWPWMAILMKEEDIPFCGGVVISERHILSAAHCLFEKFEAEDVRVRLGEYDLNKESETRYRDFDVVKITNHEEYDPGTYDHDIAIVEIDRPTHFNTYIWPICLPPIDLVIEPETIATVIGYGTTGFGAPTPNILQEVSFPVWSQEDCKQAFTQPISDLIICAGDRNGGKDSCQGDSGGPLMIELSNKRWVNIGIVSWGIRCGEKGRAGIYTRVNKYLNWIQENVKD